MSYAPGLLSISSEGVRIPCISRSLMPLSLQRGHWTNSGCGQDGCSTLISSSGLLTRPPAPSIRVNDPALHLLTQTLNTRSATTHRKPKSYTRKGQTESVCRPFKHLRALSSSKRNPVLEGLRTDDVPTGALGNRDCK